MSMELTFEDVLGKVLLRHEPRGVLPPIPSVADIVWIGSKKMEIFKRHFYYNQEGAVYRISFHCKEYGDGGEIGIFQDKSWAPLLSNALSNG
jgi:hypothetical protein